MKSLLFFIFFVIVSFSESVMADDCSDPRLQWTLGIANLNEIESQTVSSSDQDFFYIQASDKGKISIEITSDNNKVSLTAGDTCPLTFDGTSNTYSKDLEAGESFYVVLNTTNESATNFTLRATFEADTGVPEYNNEYSCGIFPSVLSSYLKITAQQNDVFATCKISVKDLNFEEAANKGVTCYEGIDTSSPKCVCVPEEAEARGNVCGSTNTCEIIPEPKNKYSHEFIETTETSTLNLSGTQELTELFYGNINIASNTKVHLNPQYTYKDEDIKVMIMGDFSAPANKTTLRFEEGDYYFNSLTLDNNPEIIIDGRVRFFIKNDFIYSGNNMSVMNNGSLFLYVGGDMEFTSSGGGNGFIDMFVYVLGDVNVEANSNAASLFGGITAEGSITISGNNMNFIYNEAGAGAIGYGECPVCYGMKAQDGTFILPNSLVNHDTFPRDTAIINQSDIILQDLVITQTDSLVPYLNSATSIGVVDENGDPISRPTTATSTTVTSEFGAYGPGKYDYYFSLRAYGSGSGINYEGISVNAHFYDSDRLYNVKLDYCDASGGGTSNVLVIGYYDAWDNGAINTDIMTKVVNTPFMLRIVSLDENGLPHTKDGIDTQFRLVDMNNPHAVTDPGITPWSDFTSSTQGSIVKEYLENDIPQAYQDVRVQFRFCVDENNASLLAPFNICDDSIPGYLFGTSTSTDNFAVIPAQFLLNPLSSEPLGLYTAGADYNFDLNATNSSNVNTPGYTIANADTVIDFGVTKLRNDDTIDNSLNGTMVAQTFSMTNGNAPLGVDLNYNEVGKIQLLVVDRDWASVDADDTPAECSPTGRFICSNNLTAITYIPDHFTFSNVNLTHNPAINMQNYPNGVPYLYISNDLNMSAGVGFTVEAKNALDQTTTNFDPATSWANPVMLDLNTTLAYNADLNVTTINNAAPLFVSGSLQIASNLLDTDKLLFNFNRAANNPLNPFVVSGTDIAVNALSIYTDNGNSKSVTGTANADPAMATTFLYGRTNGPRQTIVGDTGTALIYYEAYCSGTDSFGTVCNLALLPDGINSKNVNDIRWFRNTQHVAGALLGTVGTVTQNPLVTNRVISALPTSSNPASVLLTYDKSAGYPYTATMENNATSWLIFNTTNPNATVNQFDVEFISPPSGWAGKKETDATVKDELPSTTPNRRIMW